MSKTKILTFLAALAFMPMLLMGQSEYNPTSPDEPGAPTYQLILKATPNGSGSVSGAGYYTAGSSVSIYAYASSYYVFENWTTPDGEIISTSSSLAIEKKAEKETIIANFKYAPTTPDEPGPGEDNVMYKLIVHATNGGYASGGGKYLPGTNVSLSTSAYTGYRFVNWTNQDGDVVSLVRSFEYRTQKKSETLTANYVYDPSVPDEPSDPILEKTVEVIANEGGSCNTGVYRQLQGTTIYLHAYPNGGYIFGGWYIGNELLSMSTQCTYAVGDENVVIVAKFVYNPASPGEPLATDPNLSLYLMSMTTYPGHPVTCRMYFTSNYDVAGVRFNLSIPEICTPDWDHLTVNGNIEGLSASVQEDEEADAYVMTFSTHEGPLLMGNNLLFELPLAIPNDVDYASDNLLRINQISVTRLDGSTVTATARNGRIYLYALGDTNGDSNVDILDRVNMNTFIISDGSDNEVFIPEVSDVNEDGEYNILDTVSLINILLEQ